MAYFMIDPFEKETNKCVGDLSTHVKYNALLCMVQNAQNFFVQIYKVSGKKVSLLIEFLVKIPIN